MRRKRTLFGNRRINSYVSLPQYFETASGKELWEYLKTEKPLCLIFLTRGGYVVDIQFKKFIDIENGKEVEIESIKNSEPIPIDVPELDATEIESRDDMGEPKVGDTVKWSDSGVIFINKIIEINEVGEFVILEGIKDKVKFRQLVSIVK